MKRLLILLSVLITFSFIIVFTVFSYGIPVKSSPKRTSSSKNETITYNKNVTSFESSAVCKLIIRKGNSPKVEIHGPKAYLDITDFTFSNGRMSMKFKQNLSNTNNVDITVVLTQPKIENIRIMGVSDISGGGDFSNSNLNITIDGVADCRLTDLKCQSLSYTINGSCSATLSGNANKTSLTINGIGSIDAFNFIAPETNAYINGSGEIECFASKMLSADVHGLGNIYYKGNPLKVKTNRESSKVINRGSSSNRKTESRSKKSTRTERHEEPERSSKPILVL